MPKLYSWGERGLVASYFQDVSSQPGLAGWRSFLKVINFPRHEHLIDVWAVIEPDFGNRGFGHPDLVAVLSFDEEPKRCGLFLEAKVGGYLHASRVNRVRRGFNSSINGQLELNYRLALALSDFDAQCARLAEPQWIIGCTDYTTPSPETPRYVRSQRVLEQLAARMCGIPLLDCFHVIVTGDEGDPRSAITSERRPLIWASEHERISDVFFSKLLWTNWKKLYERSTGWPQSAFRANYDFMRIGEVVNRSTDPLPEGRARRGVSLVRLKETYYPQQPPTYFHFSWRDRSYRLRDYSGPSRKDLYLNGSPALTEVVANIEFEEHLINRKAVECFDWWHEVTLDANRRAWPEVWR